MTQVTPRSIIIIGSGVFGLSTALSLSKRKSFAATSIILLEASPTIPCSGAASVDDSRILRTDYGNATYSALAHDARKLWRDTTLTGWGGDGRYRESGFALIADGEKGKAYVNRCLDNIRVLESRGVCGVGQIEVLDGLEAVQRATGGLLPGDWGYVNWGSGWAQATKVMAWAFSQLDKQRVDVRLGAEVVALLTAPSEGQHQKKRVTGVKLANGDELEADLVVVAAGAWSSKLVDLRGRTEATGQILTYLRLEEEEERRLARVPVVMSMATGIYAIPQQDGVLKVGRNGYGYRNPVHVRTPAVLRKDSHAVSDTIEVSVPRMGVSVPMEGQEACREVLKPFGLKGDRDFERTRVCWYTDTQAGNFIISPHPDHDGSLFIATGGSGHAFKFFPVIGDKIVDAIEGCLDPDLKALWAWPEEAVQKFAWEIRPDGSRGGRMNMILDAELEITSVA
ncbi:fructosyl amino acid oxidase [Nemania abortiva]|nr:fructosyl amino acid oxidase [Nemania abortiva]